MTSRSEAARAASNLVSIPIRVDPIWGGGTTGTAWGDLAPVKRRRIEAGSMLPESETLLTPKEVAAHLDLSVKTLANWRNKGRGPAFIVLGRNGHIRYRVADILAFQDGGRATSTAQAQALTRSRGR